MQQSVLNGHHKQTMLTNHAIREEAQPPADTATQVTKCKHKHTHAHLTFSIRPLTSAVECSSGCAMQQHLKKALRITFIKYTHIAMG